MGPPAQANGAWEGSVADWREARETSDPAIWKDNTLGYPTLQEAMDVNRGRTKANMLMWYLYHASEDLIVPDEPGRGIHGAFRKPEAHKDPGRIVLMNTLFGRLLFSRFDASIATFGVNHPCYMVGISTEATHERLGNFIALPDGGVAVFFYNFDISGWSPNMCEKVQATVRRVAGKLFGTS